MSLLWCDSFGLYTTPSQKYPSGTGSGVSIVGGAGRFGGAAMQGSTSFNATNLTKDFAAQKQTLICGFAFRVTANFGANNVCLACLRDLPAAVAQCSLGMSTTGQLILYRGELTNALGNSGGLLLLSGVWYYIELKAKVDNTVGTIEVRVDGQSWVALTGQDTQNGANAYATAMQLGDTSVRATQNQVTFQMCDYYVCDDAGSVNNTFLGDVRVDPLLPSGAGASAQWTPSAGSNYQCVDDNPPNDDTDYVSDTGTVGHKDTYAMGDLPAGAQTVKGVQVNYRARKDDAGVRQIRSRVRSSATEANGATVNLTPVYQDFADVYEQDPAAAAAWTPTTVNAMEAGVEVVA